MRIERLDIQNFKRFGEVSLELNRRFTLLVGDNGAGKTSVLDALAVAAGVWLVHPPDSTLKSSGRNILYTEFRLESWQDGDRTRFIERKPVVVHVAGEILGEKLEWTRQVGRARVRTDNREAQAALSLIDKAFEQVDAGNDVLLPVIGYYGA